MNANKLNVHDGPDGESLKIGEIYGIYGSINGKIVKSFSSSGGSMFIDFKKQFDRGEIELEASIMYKNIADGCETWLDIKKNILMSPDYPNNINCSWLITAKFRSYIILNFEFVEVNTLSLNERVVDCLPLMTYGLKLSLEA